VTARREGKAPKGDANGRYKLMTKDTIVERALILAEHW
jgi:hypothetical protein